MSSQTAYECNFKTTARKLNRVKINELLEKADNSNEMMISSSIPKFRTDLKAPDITSSRDVDIEDEYIPVLRVTLESLVFEDEELKEYYNGLQSRLNKKKIDEIYNIVSSDLPFQPSKKFFVRAATKAYPLKTNKHLTKKADSQISPKFVQETLIDGEYGEPLTETADITPYNFDDFDTISEKIKNGEIKINSEDVDPSQLSFDMISQNQEKETADDLNLKIAFDMINNESEEDEQQEEKESLSDGIFSRLFKYRTVSTEEAEKVKIEEEEEYNGFEYESHEDKPEALKLLKTALNKGFKKLIQSVSLLVILLVFTFMFGRNGAFSEYLEYEKYSIIYTLIELQLLFISIAIHKGSFLKGFSSFKTGRFTSDSVFTATTILTTVHSIFSLFNTNSSPKLFNSVPILMSTFMALNTYLKCKKDLNCFNIISTDERKYVASELSPTSKEASSFYSYLSEDSDVYTVSKTNFVSSFFQRISGRPKSEDILNAVIPGIFFVSVAIFSICFFYKEMSVYNAFTAACAFITSAMPSSCIFLITLPLISANISCKRFDSAIIGDTIAEEYSTASVISFEDIELFPESKVVMTNMKVYHNMRIDQIIVELARIFSHLGGPLKSLFIKAVDGVFDEHRVIKIIKSTENGIMIAADGVDYYLGNGDFMRSNSLSYEDDQDDHIYERNGGSVMIFGANNVVAAKFYFKYTPQKGFKKLLDHMYKCGLCIGIKTLDPNINNNLLAYYADGSRCPISILKSASPEELSSVYDRVNSGIVSKRSLGAFLKAFMLCDKARHSIKSNGIVMLSGICLTALMMLFMSVTGGISDFSSSHAFLLQLLWTCAIFLLSFLK